MAIYKIEQEIRAKPVIKWAGGKGQLLGQFARLLPRKFNNYCEPFFGGGALFYYLSPKKAVLIDNNPELINFYTVVRDQLELLLADARKHKNDADYYYQVRALDPKNLTQVERASRFLFLNKTGYNGLWRVNRQGKHNVPFGRYRNPTIVDEDSLRRASAALRRAEIILGDFTEVLKKAQADDFIYFDPPYHPLSTTANFTDYTAESFGPSDQKRLAETFKALDQRGCYVMLSNSDTEFIRQLYAGYNIETVIAKRAINCRPDRRGPISELVIRNYN